MDFFKAKSRATASGGYPPHRPCRRDKGVDEVEVFPARRRLDTGRDVDPRRSRAGDRLPDVARTEPTRQHPWNAGIKAVEDRPVEGERIAARPGCALGWLGVEEQPVGDAAISPRQGKI